MIHALNKPKLTFNLLLKLLFRFAGRNQFSKNHSVNFCGTFPGFISDSGINYTKVRYELIDKEIWFNRMQGFLTAASDAESTVVDEVLENGTILSKGATTKIKSGKNKAYSNNYEGDDLKIRFYEIDNDSYLVSEYVDDNIYLYNEESLGIFHRETERLFQVKTLSVRRITDFLRRPVKARTQTVGGLKKS